MSLVRWRPWVPLRRKDAKKANVHFCAHVWRSGRWWIWKIIRPRRLCRTDAGFLLSYTGNLLPAINDAIGWRRPLCYPPLVRYVRIHQHNCCCCSYTLLFVLRFKRSSFSWQTSPRRPRTDVVQHIFSFESVLWQPSVFVKQVIRHLQMKLISAKALVMCECPCVCRVATFVDGRSPKN